MVTLEELRNKHKQIIENKAPKGGFKDGNDFASLKPGSNMVRILPGKENQLDFFVESSIHKIVGPDGKYSNYQCRKPHNESCPLCDLYFDLWQSHKDLNLGKGSDGKQKKSKYGNMATSIKAKPRYYLRAVIRDLVDTKDDNGNSVDPVKYVVASDELFNIIMAAVTNPDLADDDDQENTTMISLEKGNDFDIKITKKGEFNSFAESSVKIKKSKAGTPKQIAEWMDSKLDIRTLAKIGDYDEGKKIVQNILASLDNVSAKPQSQKSESTGEDDDGEKAFNSQLKV
jgi:hypothetical protein